MLEIEIEIYSTLPKNLNYLNNLNYSRDAHLYEYNYIYL
jgi:hypothetical protein